MGLIHLRKGEFAEAENHFARAVRRLTFRNPNPYDGEPFYNLGLARFYQGKDRARLTTPSTNRFGTMRGRARATMRLRHQRRARRPLQLALEQVKTSLRTNIDQL